MEVTLALKVKEGWAWVRNGTYRFDVDDAVALLVHHAAEQLLQPLQLDAVTYRLTPISHTQHKCYAVLEGPHLY